MVSEIIKGLTARENLAGAAAALAILALYRYAAGKNLGV